MLKSALLLLLAILAEVIGTSNLKLSDGFSKIVPSLIVIICYFLAAYLLSIVIKIIPLSITYTLWSGIGLVVITLIDFFYFNQVLTKIQLLGIFLVLIGVVCIKL